MNRPDIEPFRVLEARPRVSGSRIGAVVSIQGGPIVDFPENPLGPQPAKVVSALAREMLTTACEARLPVLLVFENDDPSRPIVVDVIIDHPSSGAADVPWIPPDEAAPTLTDTEVIVPGVGLATIVAVAEDTVWVSSHTAGATAPIPAKTAVTLRNLKDSVVVLSLRDGTAVVIAQLHPVVQIEPAGGEDADVLLKGRTVTIEAEAKLVLKAGACTVELDGRGKVQTTADQIVSRARGTNKVQGGCVQLN